MAFLVRRIWRWLPLVMLSCSAIAGHAQGRGKVAAQDELSLTTEALIDQLVKIDLRAPGVDSAAIYDGFLAAGKPGTMQVGVLGPGEPRTPPAMLELVRRGAGALPFLLAHLSDSRATGLVVGNTNARGKRQAVGINVFMFELMSDEYDGRSWEPSGAKGGETQKSFYGSYTVKVGDVCYALVGQIVNRRLLPVRYQPSAGIVVNSPLEAPVLVMRTRADWGTTGAGELQASLMRDLRSETEVYMYATALVRLRFYFPEAYKGLVGKDLTKRRRFERYERSGGG
jgi:hypothetical protein